MFWETLDFTKKLNQTKISLGMCPVKSIFIDTRYPGFPSGKHLFIGVDPGINFGITLISTSVIEIMYGRLPRLGEFAGMNSMHLIEKLGYEYDLASYDPKNLHVYVEGAAYKSRYGQVELEQVRFGFVQGFSKFVHQDNIKYIPPSTARKKAFGSGKKSAKDLFVNINHNGADSIGVALACITDYIGDVT